MREIDLNAEPSDPVIAARLKAIGDAIMNSPRFLAVVAASRALDARAAFLRKKLGRPALGIEAATAVGTTEIGPTEGESPTAKPERPNTGPHNV